MSNSDRSYDDIRYNDILDRVEYFNGSDWYAATEPASAITALTGDVTAAGAGSVAATVASVGGSTAAHVHSAELLANAAIDSNSASTIVRRAADGSFSAGLITGFGGFVMPSGVHLDLGGASWGLGLNSSAFTLSNLTQNVCVSLAVAGGAADRGFAIGQTGGASKVELDGNGLLYVANRISVGTNAPNASAVACFSSTTSGFLPPVMTNTQRDAIATPAEGLVIYSTSDHALEFFNGTSWKVVATV